MTIRSDKLTRPGMTLVEVLVAVGILVVMVAGVGYVFTSSSKAVRVTQATIETNAGVRATMGRLREDLQSLTPDGVLFICNAAANGGPDGDPTPTILMFTATGRYESRMNSAITSNAALIVYMPVWDAQGGPAILARYTFLLTGDATLPSLFPNASLRDLIGNDRPSIGELDRLSEQDYLSVSLGDIRASVTRPHPNSFIALYVAPLLTRYARLNSAPQTIVYAGGFGGVVNLWPYMIGGCDAFHIDFADGRNDIDGDSDGVADPVDPYPDEPVAWMNPDVDAVRDLRRPLGGSTAVGLAAMPGGNVPAYIMWNYRNKELWPDALQIRLELKDAAGRLEKVKPYEAVFELP